MAICVYGVVLFCLGVCSISLVSAVVVGERLSSAVVVFPFIYPLRLLRASVRACVRACGAVPCRACARRAGCGSARLSSVRRSAADSVATPPPPNPQHLPPPTHILTYNAPKEPTAAQSPTRPHVPRVPGVYRKQLRFGLVHQRNVKGGTCPYKCRTTFRKINTFMCNSSRGMKGEVVTNAFKHYENQV